MPKDKLTQKQENFCINMIKGLSQREAYLQAGYSNTMLPNVVNVRASELAAASKIQVRIQELRDVSQASDILSLLEQSQKLTAIARAPVITSETVSVKAALKAIKDLGERMGAYQPTTFNDNRVINFVVSDKARALIEKGIAGTLELEPGTTIIEGDSD